ncbi:MAG: hypothetical protein AB8V03_08065 [Francisella endosymbiont of Hyalomma asiaticum]
MHDYSKDILNQAKLELRAKLKQIIKKLEENKMSENDIEYRKEIDKLKFLILETKKIKPIKFSIDTHKPKG